MYKHTLTVILLLLFTLTISQPVLADNGKHVGQTKNENVSQATQSTTKREESTHPSANDRSSEKGNSTTQGKSQSDPDGITNGGQDKPGGTGGVDKKDQDGNNGCGNDNDFEDDNKGNCGGHKHLMAVVVIPTKTPVVQPTATPILRLTAEPTGAPTVTPKIQDSSTEKTVLAATTLPNTGHMLLNIAIALHVLAALLATAAVIIPSKIISKEY